MNAVMHAVKRSARGASVHVQAEEWLTRPLDERALLVSDPNLPSEHLWSRLIDELLTIRTLGDNWDGQGAEAPCPVLVDGAIAWAQSLRANGTVPADRVIAGVNGTIFFEWHGPDGYTEIEVIAPDRAEGRSVKRGEDMAEVFSLSLRS